MSGSFAGELARTAELLVEVAERDGIYFAVALLYDSSYTSEDLGKLLPILLNTKGSTYPEKED